MNTLRRSDEIEALKSDLRALRHDLRDVVNDVGVLTNAAAEGLRQRAPALGDWLRRAADYDLNTRAGREAALAALRTHGNRSAAVLRSTVQDHPISAAVGALALGLAVAWFLSRPSSR